MRPLMEERGREMVWFRYPFLDSGMTQEVHQSIMDFLEEHHYRVAHVTVDYKDYSFAGVYSRLVRAGDAATSERVKQAYLDQIDPGFERSEKASLEILGYELPQILLIHCNELNSVTLRDSIARMRKRGYTFELSKRRRRIRRILARIPLRARVALGSSGQRDPWERRSALRRHVCRSGLPTCRVRRDDAVNATKN